MSIHAHNSRHSTGNVKNFIRAPYAPATPSRNWKNRVEIITQAERAIVGCDKAEKLRLIKVCEEMNMPKLLERLRSTL